MQAKPTSDVQKHSVDKRARMYLSGWAGQHALGLVAPRYIRRSSRAMFPRVTPAGRNAPLMSDESKSAHKQNAETVMRPHTVRELAWARLKELEREGTYGRPIWKAEKGEGLVVMSTCCRISRDHHRWIAILALTMPRGKSAV